MLAHIPKKKSCYAHLSEGKLKCSEKQNYYNAEDESIGGTGGEDGNDPSL